MSPSVHTRRNLLLGAVLGLLALAAGVALADTFLPEWRAGEPPNPERLRERYREMAARAGFLLEPGKPQTLLVTQGPEQREPFRSLGDRGTDWLLATRSAVRAQVIQEVRDSDGRRGYLAIGFSFDGLPQAMAWYPASFSPFEPVDLQKASLLADRLAPLALGPGEALGPRQQATMGTFPRLLYPITGSPRPQHLVIMVTQGAFLDRHPGPLTAASGGEADAYVAYIASIF